MKKVTKMQGAIDEIRKNYTVEILDQISGVYAPENKNSKIYKKIVALGYTPDDINTKIKVAHGANLQRKTQGHQMAILKIKPKVNVWTRYYQNEYTDESGAKTNDQYIQIWADNEILERLTLRQFFEMGEDVIWDIVAEKFDLSTVYDEIEFCYIP